MDTDIAKQIINACGSLDNIVSYTTCLTRLRIVVKNPTLIHAHVIQNLPDVLGVKYASKDAYTIEIVFGPKKIHNIADAFARVGKIPMHNNTTAQNTSIDSTYVQKQKPTAFPLEVSINTSGHSHSENHESIDALLRYLDIEEM